MKAKDIMTKDVITVRENTDVKKIISLLLEHRISAVPVVDEKNYLLGVVSEGDLLYKKRLPTSIDWVQNYGQYYYTRPEQLLDEHRKIEGTTAKEIMTPVPISVDEETAVSEIAKIMLKRGIKRVFVLHEGKLVGVVSRGDILKEIITEMNKKDFGGLSPDEQKEG